MRTLLIASLGLLTACTTTPASQVPAYAAFGRLRDCMFTEARDRVGGPSRVASQASLACAGRFDEFEAAYVAEAPLAPIAERVLADDGGAWVRFEAEAQAGDIRKALVRAVERMVERRKNYPPAP